MRVCPYCHIYLPETEPSCPRDGEQAIEVEPEAIPVSLGERFEFVESFARGGTGSSYLVDDTLTGRHGLLKVLRFSSGAYAAERMRIKRELAKQTSLSDGAVAQIIASGETPEEGPTGKALWLFREWVEGESLKLLLKRQGALEPPRALAVAAQIASGLDVLHRAGLLHRDLKPGHVILQSHLSGIPRVTIVDVGIAVRIESTALFDLMGTPSYVSPEQAAGKLVSFRSDLYSLGCVLYEMLVGKPPFTGHDVNALLEAHRITPAPVPEMELPDAVLSLLAALLAKDPRERPFSAQQVRRTLDPLLPQAVPTGKASTILSAAGARPASIPPLRTAPGIPSPVKAAPAAENQPRNVQRPSQPERASSSPPEVSPAPIPEALAREPVAEPEVQELGTGEFDVLMEIPSKAKALAESAAALGRIPKSEDQQYPAAVASTPSEPPSEVTQQLQEHEIELAPDKPAGVTDTSPTALISAEHLESVLEAAAQETPESPIERFAAMMRKQEPQEAPFAQQQAPVHGPEEADERDDETTAFVKGADLVGPGAAAPYAHEAADLAAASGIVGEAGRAGLDAEAALPRASKGEQRSSTWDIDYPDQKPVADPFGTKTMAMPIIRDRRVMGGVVGGLIVAAMLFFFIGRDRSSEVDIQEVGAKTDPLMTGSPAEKREAASSSATATERVEGETAATKQPEPAAEPRADEQPPPAAETAEAAAQPQETPAVTAEEEPEEPETETGAEQPAPARSIRKAAVARQKPKERVPVIADTATAPATTPAVPAKGGALDRKAKSDELREEGRQHYAAGRYREAANAYREATRYAPSHAGSYAGLGASLLASGDPDGAIAAYQRAIQLQPRSSGFHAALGRAYYTKGDGGRAVAAYRKALELNPNNKIARMALVRLGQQ